MAVAVAVAAAAWGSAYLDRILHAGAFVQTALADGVGSHTDVLLDVVGVRELRRASVQLLSTHAHARTHTRKMNVIIQHCSVLEILIGQ